VRAVENFLGGENNDDRISSGITIFNIERSENVKTVRTSYLVLEEIKPARHNLSPPFSLDKKIAARKVDQALQRLVFKNSLYLRPRVGSK